MKNILIAVAGMTPAVITETIYYMLVKRNVCFDEVYVITTSHGKQKMEEQLYGGVIADIYADYGRSRSEAPKPEPVLIYGENGEVLEDVRTAGENKAAATTIVDFVREKANNPDCSLHCSIAGGRKTMSSYMALALNFFGREQDSLSHVLVTPSELEKPGRNFFYPKPDDEEAEVELAEIPFIRLREKLEEAYGTSELDFDLLMKLSEYSPDDWKKEVFATWNPATRNLDVSCNEQEYSLQVPFLEATFFHLCFKQEGKITFPDAPQLAKVYEYLDGGQDVSFDDLNIQKTISSFNRKILGEKRDTAKNQLPGFIIPHLRINYDKKRRVYFISLPFNQRKMER